MYQRLHTYFGSIFHFICFSNHVLKLNLLTTYPGELTGVDRDITLHFFYNYIVFHCVGVTVVGGLLLTEI